MSSIAVLDDHSPRAAQDAAARSSGTVHGPTFGPVLPEGAVVENVLGRVSVVRGSGAVEQIGHADPLREGLARVHMAFTFALAAYNLIRLPKPLGASA